MHTLNKLVAGRDCATPGGGGGEEEEEESWTPPPCSDSLAVVVGLCCTRCAFLFFPFPSPICALHEADRLAVINTHDSTRERETKGGRGRQGGKE